MAIEYLKRGKPEAERAEDDAKKPVPQSKAYWPISKRAATPQ